MVDQLQITPLHPTIGARVYGLDLCRPVSDALRDAIDAAMDRHAVLVFPEQELDDEQQVAFASRFGPIEDAASGVKDRNPRLANRQINDISNLAADGAIMAADDFDKRVAAAATITDMSALESEVSKLRSALDATVMDYYRKDCLKQAVDGLKEKVLAAEKEALKAKIAAATTWAESVDVSAKFVVLSVDVDGDIKGLDAAMKVVNTKAPLGLLSPPPPHCPSQPSLPALQYMYDGIV